MQKIFLNGKAGEREARGNGTHAEKENNRKRHLNEG